MSKTLLVTRPNYDPSTAYLFHWSKRVIGLAKKKGFNVIDVSGEKAVWASLKGRIEKTDPVFIFFNGHGDQTTIMGQDDKVLISVGKNEEILKNRIIFSRSCSSAKKLGPRSIRCGTRAFIGYAEPFIFIYDSRKSTRPLADKTAALFLDPSNKVAVGLLKGHSSAEADQRAKGDFRRNIRKLLTSETKREDSEVLRYLFWDMKHQVCLGDPNASL